MAVIIPTQIAIEIFPDRVKTLLTKRPGMVTVATRRAALAVKDKAIKNITHKYPSDDRTDPPLAKSGRVQDGSGNSYRVSFVNPHAYVYHEGHKKARIYPKSKKGYLVFKVSDQGGGYIHAKSVKGFKGNPFLANAAKQMGLNLERGGAATGARLGTQQVLLAGLRGPAIKKFT